MEFRGEANGQWLIFAARFFLAVDVVHQGGHLLLRKLAREARHNELLHRDTDFENIARFVPARDGNRGSPIAPEFYKAFGGKLPQRIAHDGAAGTKLLTDRVLG